MGLQAWSGEDLGMSKDAVSGLGFRQGVRLCPLRVLMKSGSQARERLCSRNKHGHRQPVAHNSNLSLIFY